ncbi:MAG: hypothetical protein JO210_00020 [Acidobacteriaceae bacterium]|nr:hypothetical protein [Acidobacteriaceae bacterium]
MKHIATVALMLNLGVAGVYAHEKPVKMTFSGTSATSATDLQQPDTNNDEDNFAGDGTLGRFTLHQIRAVTKNPDPSGTCPSPSQIHFSEPAGAGVFRFHGGSLLNVILKTGDDCIDFLAMEAHCTITFQITGGTGRFKNASGVLTFTETVKPVLADVNNKPVFFAATGEFTGTVSGAAREEEERQDERQ